MSGKHVIDSSVSVVIENKHFGKAVLKLNIHALFTNALSDGAVDVRSAVLEPLPEGVGYARDH